LSTIGNNTELSIIVSLVIVENAPLPVAASKNKHVSNRNRLADRFAAYANVQSFSWNGIFAGEGNNATAK
jgi:hypothetical protein